MSSPSLQRPQENKCPKVLLYLAPMNRDISNTNSSVGRLVFIHVCPWDGVSSQEK